MCVGSTNGEVKTTEDKEHGEHTSRVLTTGRSATGVGAPMTSPTGTVTETKKQRRAMSLFVMAVKVKGYGVQLRRRVVRGF